MCVVNTILPLHISMLLDTDVVVVIIKSKIKCNIHHCSEKKKGPFVPFNYCVGFYTFALKNHKLKKEIAV